MNGRIVWRYLTSAIVACFFLLFYSWYSLSNVPSKKIPTGPTVVMPVKFVHWTDKTGSRNEQSFTKPPHKLQRTNLFEDGRVLARLSKYSNKSLLRSQANEEWLPGYYADNFKNDPSLSYLRERVVGYCNPPELTTTGKEGIVVPGYALQSVHVLIRHGDRTPLESNGMETADIDCNLMMVSQTIPDQMFELLATDLNEWKDLLKREDSLMLSDMKLKTSLRTSAFSSINLNYLSALTSDSSKCRTSQMTPNGWRQHLAIGEFLRNAYTPHNLLNPEAVNYKDVMSLHSTTYSRTMQSAIALLYGLLPEDQILKTPALKTTRALNFCEGKMCDCSAVHNLLNQVSLEKSRHKIDHEYTRKITKSIKNILYGDDQHSPKLPHFFALLDHFTSFLCHNKKLPCGPTKCLDLDQVQEVFKYVDKLEDDLKSHDDSLSMKHARLFMYPLLKEITDAISFNSTKHRFSLYSGHDLTITPFLAILGLPDFRWPNYAARIIIEAWSKFNKKFIRVLYNGDDMTDKLRFCRNQLNQDGLCPLTQLVDFVNKQNFVLFNAKSYEEACLSSKL
ncbi:2-phosphoxylose phosphatase 1-like [Anneissia japonica]|uniref:2-phosphoxylose phosphatase 1-like n=1 Tax=Anneissia japonica TaxID=1529436 RepID=UPI0014259534|nr:2-phosphoxylose phosphatase 1-like [Anneissia japonica]XP_033097834.1 2-phosphoxylose phosphatase 1-like [Anneissia japonica]